MELRCYAEVVVKISYQKTSPSSCSRPPEASKPLCSGIHGYQNPADEEGSHISSAKAKIVI